MVLPVTVTTRAIIIAHIASYAAMYITYGASNVNGTSNSVVAKLYSTNSYFNCFINSSGQIGIQNTNANVAQRLTIFYL